MSKLEQLAVETTKLELAVRKNIKSLRSEMLGDRRARIKLESLYRFIKQNDVQEMFVYSDMKEEYQALLVDAQKAIEGG